MGSMIDVTAADGHQFAAYRAGAETAGKGLVVLQEIFWGQSAHAPGGRRFRPAWLCSDRAGAVRPGRTRRGTALCRRRRAARPGATRTNPDRGHDGRHCRLCRDARRAAARHCRLLLGRDPGVARRVAQRRMFTLRSAGMAAASRRRGRSCRIARCSCISARWIPASPMPDVAAIGKLHPEVEIFIYQDAGHGFGCEERESYASAAATEAQARTLEFFQRHL